MDIILVTSLPVLLILSLLLYQKIRRQSESLADANQQLQRFNQILDGVVDDNDMTASPPAMRVSVRIHDPVAVAKKLSVPAQLVGDLAPAMITKKVYQELTKEIANSLEERNIEADINIETY